MNGSYGCMDGMIYFTNGKWLWMQGVIEKAEVLTTEFKEKVNDLIK